MGPHLLCGSIATIDSSSAILVLMSPPMISSLNHLHLELELFSAAVHSGEKPHKALYQDTIAVS